MILSDQLSISNTYTNKMSVNMLMLMLMLIVIGNTNSVTHKYINT